MSDCKKHNWLTIYKNGIADSEMCRNCHESRKIEEDKKHSIFEGAKMDARMAVEKLFEGGDE